jgi:hypothetical protein
VVLSSGMWHRLNYWLLGTQQMPFLSYVISLLPAFGNVAAFLLKHWKTIAAVVFLLGAGVEGYMLRAKEDARAALEGEAKTLKSIRAPRPLRLRARR